MKNSLRILNNYFLILKKLGYLNYKETLSIFVYIIVKEISDILAQSKEEDLKHFIVHYLNDIKDNSPIIADNISNFEQMHLSADPVFGIVDNTQTAYTNVLIEDLIQAMEDANVFMVL